MIVVQHLLDQDQYTLLVEVVVLLLQVIQLQMVQQEVLVELVLQIQF